jgi:hypothetical protein
MTRSIRAVSVALVCGLLATQADAPRLTPAAQFSLSAQPRMSTAPPSQTFHTPAQASPQETGYSAPFQLRTAIERALVSLDPREREAAFTLLLPQLIERDPALAEQLLERCDAGPVCDELFRRALTAAADSDIERASQWVANVLQDEKRHEAAQELTRHLARKNPGVAIEVANRFDVGRDDGSLEHLMQLWAVENPTQAQRWLEAQPAGPQRDQLYARFKLARSGTPP